MKKILFKAACVFSAVCVLQSAAFAQDTVSRTTTTINPPLFSGKQGFRTWSIGIHGGAIAPFSAFGGRNDFSDWKTSLGYGLYLKNQLSHGLAMQLDFFRGNLEANNDRDWAGAPPVSPYQSFRSNIHWATSLSAVVTLGNINWSQLRTTVQPYVSLGAGAINTSSTLVTAAGATVEYDNGDKNTSFFVPLGLGLRANLSDHINLDLGYRVGFVDGDDIDGYFKEPYLSDKFSYLHVGLEFSLGNRSKPQLARHNAPAQLSDDIMRKTNDALSASLAAGEERYRQRQAELDALRNELARMKGDADGDGVSDFFDKCPGTAAGVKVDGSGCPLPTPPPPVKDTVVQQTTTYIITDEDREIINVAMRNLEFDFAKATIRSRSFPYLNRVTDLLVKKGISLKLAGHTDNVGSDAANMKLSKARAEAVKSYLVSQGASASRIEAVGYGESQPISTNNTAAGRQTNRRVEFTIY
jgi:OOP family OmpA-OmpF porin